MRSQNAKIVASSIMGLLLSSFVVIMAGVNNADAQEANPSEVGVASGSNRFVVWSDSTPGNYEILFRRSTDNGATWQATKNLSNTPGPSDNPRIAVSGSHIYVVWIQRNSALELPNVFFRHSADNGATWGPKLNISLSGDVYFPGLGFSLFRVAVSGSYVYVTWSGNDGEIYLRRSTDNGATWKPILNISNNPGPSTYHELAASGSNVYVVWFQESADGTLSDAFFRRSTDNGATWQFKVNLSKSGEAYSVPDIAVSGSNIHVAWSQADPASGWPVRASVFVKSSSDGGATWKTSKNLTPTAAFDSISPRIASVGSNVYVLYEYSEPNQDCCDFAFAIVFVASTDNGGTWKSGITLRESSGPRSEVGPGHQIVALGSKVYVLWHESGDREVDGYLQFRRSTNNGVTWSSEVKDINSPIKTFQIAASGSSVYIVYTAQAVYDEPLETFFLRSIDSGATWKPVKNLSANSGSSYSVQIAV